MFKYIIVSFLFICLCTSASTGEFITGEVGGVLDGDTVVLETGKGTTIKVRLWGIDAPEKEQDYGDDSRRLLKRLIDGEEVRVYVMDIDKYGRSIGKIFFEGEYINHTMVKEGAAWWYEKYAPDDVDLYMAEQWARYKEDGLWSKDNPTAPWDFRHGTTTQSRAPPVKQEQVKKPEQEERNYWLNTSSGSRHNRSCKWFANTKRGRFCTRGEGRACGICGG